jgi:hypothetical protein
LLILRRQGDGSEFTAKIQAIYDGQDPNGKQSNMPKNGETQ